MSRALEILTPALREAEAEAAQLKGVTEAIGRQRVILEQLKGDVARANDDLVAARKQIAEAQDVIERAKVEAKAITDAAQAKAGEIIRVAHAEAGKIVANVRKKVSEIAA